MLQLIREKAKGFVAVIVALLVLSTLLWGLNDLFMSNKHLALAAKVNGEPIYWDSIDRLFESVRGQIEGQGLTPELEAGFKNQLRQRMIQQVATITGSHKQGFRISAQQVQAYLHEFPQFQVNGKFSKARFKQSLDQAGLKEDMFLKQVQQELLHGQVQQAVVLSHFVDKNEVDLAGRLFEQTRDIGYVSLPFQKFEAGLEVSDADLKKYFEQEQTVFARPEQVSLEYVQLSLDELMKTIVVTPEVLKTFYQDHTQRYILPEKAHARHILFAVPREAANNSSEEAHAKAEAQKIYEQLKAGADFKALAKAHSNDPGSKDQGGDLGWLERGETVPEFEKALFSLTKDGQLSEVIRSPFGYHIIELIAHEPEQTRGYAEVADLVEEHFRRSQAQAIYEEKAETMGTLAFENPNSLEKLVADLGLSLHRTPFFSRAGGPDIAQHPAIIKAAFEPELLNDGHNSEVIALDGHSCAVVRVHTRQAAFTPAFADIISDVKAHYFEKKAQEHANEVAQQIQKALTQGDDLKTLLAQYHLEWKTVKALSRDSQTLAPIILNTAFSLSRSVDAPHKKSSRIIDSAPKELTVVALDEVHENTTPLSDDAKKMYLQSLMNVEGDLEYSLYAHELIKAAKVSLTATQAL